ncbi:MAG: fibronectin type III-like domain-contianing protein [Myxococcales bacterium]|nr:fibronectin type III-like domain-contianing protein [Myxococcales bacterium]
MLFGDVNPSGHLPVSFPASEADLPPFDNVSLKVDYGYLHGYRHLDHEKKSPLFPFGHGLSYTRYEYTNLRIDEDTVAAAGTLRATCDVQNTGARAGRATVQLYIGAPDSLTLRAPRDLRGFAQVELAAGEKKSVTIEVPVASLAIWDGSAMTVQATSYRVEVGASAGDLPLVAQVMVAP